MLYDMQYANMLSRVNSFGLLFTCANPVNFNIRIYFKNPLKTVAFDIFFLSTRNNRPESNPTASDFKYCIMLPVPSMVPTIQKTAVPSRIKG
jgi:hypothetical protein